MFYSGDTAQTITKGITFKFADIKKLFDFRTLAKPIQKEKPDMFQLIKGFRSQNSILKLANTVIQIIENLFPDTIDILKKESSRHTGPKPMIVQDVDLLKDILSHEQTGKYRRRMRQENELGLEQVIIVRDSEEKKMVPKELQSTTCLTVKECKGLEFNDVILFNFFSSCKCLDQYKVLKNYSRDYSESAKLK